MLGQLIGPDILEMMVSRQYAEVRQALSSLTPDVVAEVFSEMSPQDVAVLFRILPRESAADIFEYMPLEAQEALLHSLGQEQVAAVLNEMAPDDRTALLEELPGTVTQRLISMLSPEERKVATELLGYPAQSIGRRMTPDYVAVREGWTVSQVLEQIRKVGRDKETLNVIYVVDERGRLVDDIRLRELILADPNARLTDIMNRQFSVLRADLDQEEAVREFQRLDRVALPVVDSSGLLVGMITVDDVMDVAEEEVTEDVHRMGAVQALEAPYLNVGFFTMVRKRAVWLSLLFFGGTLTATAMKYFQAELDKAMMLALFVPLVLSSGGNSGSQAASLITRALAIQELHLRDWWKILYRELGTGLALGGVLGSISVALIVFSPSRDSTFGVHYLHVAATVSISLVGVVTYGTFVGAMLPILLKRLGFDPAVSSTPFVATLVDVMGLIIYFTIASMMLRGTLL
ncbi:MAG: magnesium transporter [Planctomycetota bacterium]